MVLSLLSMGVAIVFIRMTIVITIIMIIALLVEISLANVASIA